MKKVCDSMEHDGKLLCRYDAEVAMGVLDAKMKGEDENYMLGLIVDELPADIAAMFIKRHNRTAKQVFSKNAYLLRP